MPSLDEVLAMARQLSVQERERLVRELLGAARPGLPQVGPAGPRPPAPHSVEWVKAERGHAVLATDTGLAEGDIPAGAEAIAGMWADTGEQP
jgi:hypothetical protein